MCVCVCLCCYWCVAGGGKAAGVTVAHEKVSDSEDHQIREEDLTQPVAIDRGSTGRPTDHRSEHGSALATIAAGSEKRHGEKKIKIKINVMNSEQ